MPIDHIRYDLLTQEALRGVVRTILADVAKNGLPGEHHFFISFDTHGEGVQVSPRLRAQWPEEMTIVLQHQFWDLTVTDEQFEVGLSFNGVPERVVVPFEAITGFADPSVQFGLQFQPISEEDEDEEPVEEPKPAPAKAAGKSSTRQRRPARHPETPREAADASPTALPANPTPAATPTDDGPDLPTGGAEVVRFDRFRKKK